jgi:hypothetical protein
MFAVPRDPLRLVSYAFQALGKTQVPLQQLVFFLSFDLRTLPPSQVKKAILDLQAQGQLEINDEMVLAPQIVAFEKESMAPTSTQDLGEQLRLFVSSSRLSRAVGMNDQAIEFQRISQNPLKIKATVQGSKEYLLELDEEAKIISHDCPDWQRVSVIHRLCKHVAKLILLLEKDEALRILKSLQKDSWKFIQI